MTWNKDIDGGIRNPDYPGYTIRWIDGPGWRLRGPHSVLEGDDVFYRTQSLAMLAAESVAEDGKLPNPEPKPEEPKNWVVYGQENHPDRFVTDDIYGPYTEAEAEAEVARLESSPLNFNGSHKLYYYYAKELTA